MPPTKDRGSVKLADDLAFVGLLFATIAAAIWVGLALSWILERLP